MKLNSNHIRRLALERGWSQNELARRASVAKGTLSRSLNGKSGAGRKLIAGLMRALPGESIESLIIAEKEVG